MTLPEITLGIKGRVCLTVLLVLAITMIVGAWELYPLVATQSVNGNPVSVEVVSTEMERWTAILLTSTMAAGIAIAVLSFATKWSGRGRGLAWVFVIALMWGLPRLGVFWPELDLLARGWILHLPDLYEFWPLFSIFPIVLLVHRCVPKDRKTRSTHSDG